MANARQIAGLGAREIVLTGVNIGDFGNGTDVIEGDRPRKAALFADLVRELDRVEEVARYREILSQSARLTGRFDVVAGEEVQ